MKEKSTETPVMDTGTVIRIDPEDISRVDMLAEGLRHLDEQFRQATESCVSLNTALNELLEKLDYVRSKAEDAGNALQGVG